MKMGENGHQQIEEPEIDVFINGELTDLDSWVESRFGSLLARPNIDKTEGFNQLCKVGLYNYEEVVGIDPCIE